MKTFLLSLALSAAFFAAPAFADCLADIARAEEAMKAGTIDQAKADEAKILIDKAKTANNNSNNAVCEQSAKELVLLLGLPTTQ